MKRVRLLVLGVMALSGGCAQGEVEGSGPTDAITLPAATVDSAAPVAAALERFRAGLTPVDRPRGGASSPAALIREMAALIASADTAGLQRMTMDRAEFAFLYYPSTPLARPPYELPPELAWFRLDQENRIAMRRVLRELGGSDTHGAELHCPQPPAMQGENRIHAGCVVRLPAGELRLFGSLVERDGAVKVLSWANDF